MTNEFTLYGITVKYVKDAATTNDGKRYKISWDIPVVGGQMVTGFADVLSIADVFVILWQIDQAIDKCLQVAVENWEKNEDVLNEYKKHGMQMNAVHLKVKERLDRMQLSKEVDGHPVGGP